MLLFSYRCFEKIPEITKNSPFRFEPSKRLYKGINTLSNVPEVREQKDGNGVSFGKGRKVKCMRLWIFCVSLKLYTDAYSLPRDNTRNPRIYVRPP